MRIRLFSIAALQYSAFAINIGLQFLLTLLVAPEIFGIYAKLQSTTDILTGFLAISLHTAILQLQEETTEKLIKHTFLLGILQVILLLSVGLIVFSTLYYFKIYNLKEAILGELLLFATALLILKQLVYVVYEKNKEFVFNSKINLYVNAISAILTIVYVCISPSIELLIIRIVASNLLLFGIYMYLLFFKLNFNWGAFSLDRNLLKQIINFSLRLYFARLVEMLQSRIDIIVVSYLFDNYHIGIYERIKYYALMVSSLVNALTNRINIVSYRQQTSLHILYYSHTIISLTVPILYCVGFFALMVLKNIFSIPAFEHLFPLYFCFWAFAGLSSITENLRTYLQIHYAVIRTSLKLRFIPLIFFLSMTAIFMLLSLKPTIEWIAFLSSCSYLSIFLVINSNLYLFEWLRYVKIIWRQF